MIMTSLSIDRDTIRLGLSASDWEEGIRLASAPLIEKGSIEKRYVDAMIDSVHRNGPYFVLTRGMALAHARPEDGVIKADLALATLHTPLTFHAGDNDPVRLIIVLAAQDSHSHLDVISALADVISDPESLGQLIEAQEISQVVSLLNEEMK